MTSATAIIRRINCAPAPGFALARKQKGGSLRPRALRVARDRHCRSAHGPALGTPREGAWRGHAKGRDFPHQTQQPAPRFAGRSRFATATAFGLAWK